MAGSSPAMTKINCGLYFFALRFFAVFFFATFFFEAFFGTFAPSALASDSPIAIACLRLVTLRPERPLFNVPALRFFITRSTSAEALLEYFRAMIILPVAKKIIFARADGSLETYVTVMAGLVPAIHVFLTRCC
jgi:hypothetical protein